MKLYDGLPEPGPCEGCGYQPCRCKPAPRPAPEPLADVLRRLAYQAATGCLCGLPTCTACADEANAKRVLRNAIPVLADIVAAVEVEDAAKPNHPRHACPLCRSLAALREQLSAKS